jgi:hypothetical protein
MSNTGALRDGPVYFDIIDGDHVLVDPDGSDYTDANAARAEAVAIAVDLIREGLRVGKGLGLDRVVRIVGRDGDIIEEVAFCDAVEASRQTQR